MTVTLVNGLPPLRKSDPQLTLRVCGPSAYVRSPDFIARFCLESGEIEWVVKRSCPQFAEGTVRLPRWISIFGLDLWVDQSGRHVAELLPTESGELTVCVWNAETGRLRWEYYVSIPPVADWAEPSPIQPGYQIEELDAFIADDPNRLVVCLFRQSRRSGSSAENYRLPTYACQTDGIRLEPTTGNVLWRASFADVRIGILERRSFTGIWSNDSHLGVLDLETGTNTILHRSPGLLGWPVRHGRLLAVPWHLDGQIGIDWIDQQGRRIRNGAWPQPRVRCTELRATDSGLALQTNDQTLWWLGDEVSPLWKVRAKPYIYRVHCSAESDVFVGTDGNGGRVVGLDRHSGRETLNLRPVVGGVGSLAKVPGHDVLVSGFMASRSRSVPCQLLVLSMRDRRHALVNQCQSLVGTWEHGAICIAGERSDQLAIADIRLSSK